MNAAQQSIQTLEELSERMVRDLHAHAYESGPDLEDEHLSYEHLVLPEAREKWKAELKKNWVKFRGIRRGRDAVKRRLGRSFILATTQPTVESSGKDNKAARKALAAKIIERHQEEFRAPDEEPKGRERFQFDEEAITPVLFKNTPLDNAKAFARDRLRKDGMIAMHRYRENWWQWNGRFYETAPDERISAMVYPLGRGERGTGRGAS